MTATRHPAPNPDVVAEIIAHLKQNPRAGDTALGIWQWWLIKTRDRTDMESVAFALEYLVARGEVRSRLLATGERYYYSTSAPDPGGKADGDG